MHKFATLFYSGVGMVMVQQTPNHFSGMSILWGKKWFISVNSGSKKKILVDDGSYWIKVKSYERNVSVVSLPPVSVQFKLMVQWQQVAVMLTSTNMLTKISYEGGQVLTNKNKIRLLPPSPVLPNPLNFVTPPISR